MSNGGWTGWDIIERYTGRLFDAAGVPGDHVVELHPDTVATALLVEMERPPWWRDIDRQRRQLARETA